MNPIVLIDAKIWINFSTKLSVQARKNMKQPEVKVDKNGLRDKVSDNLQTTALLRKSAQETIVLQLPQGRTVPRHRRNKQPVVFKAADQ